jgi:CDP-glycerol glycerophosphotransferase (TagB/SpsB family)
MGTQENRETAVERAIKILESNKLEPMKESIIDAYYNQGIQEKAVALVGLGKNVRGSMQYILNELNYSSKFEGYTMYVRTDADTDPIVNQYIKDNNWNRTQTVPAGAEFERLIETVKYLISEVYFTEAWIKKEGQVYINIWHGTPLKKLGLDKNTKNCHRNGVTQKNFINADYLLYPNEYTRNNMLKSYKVSPLMNGEVLMMGYPRTGGMLAASESDQSELRAQLAPNGEKIYAYMPTFRDYMAVKFSTDQVMDLLTYLDENLGDDKILYVNLHHKVNDSVDYSVFKHIKKFPSNVDSYKILALTEALISDYSSVFFDYLALGKQIILYMDDYATYQKKRGTYMDIMKLPFDKCKTKEAVLEAINRGKTYSDEAVRKKFCRYDTSKNAQQLCKLFYEGGENELELKSIPKNNLPNILIFSDTCSDNLATSVLDEYVGYLCGDTRNIFVACDMDKVNDNKDSAYPMLFNVPVIGCCNDMRFTAIGKSLVKLYNKKKISFNQYIDYMQYDYKAIARRFFGIAKFDKIVAYDMENPDMVLALSQMEGDKILCLNEKTFELIDENALFKDAMLYFSERCDDVIVLSEQDKATYDKSYKKMFNKEAVLVEDSYKMDEILKYIEESKAVKRRKAKMLEKLEKQRVKTLLEESKA